MSYAQKLFLDQGFSSTSLCWSVPQELPKHQSSSTPCHLAALYVLHFTPFFTLLVLYCTLYTLWSLYIMLYVAWKGPSDTLHKNTRSPESNSPESPAPTSAHLDETQLYPLRPSCCTTIRIAVTCAGASEVAIYFTFTTGSLKCPSNCQTSLGEHFPGSAF